MNTHIRFDWAMKRLLRQKANFGILEGFLSELLMEQIEIQELLESESNQEEFDDKFNRVDILVKNSKEELMLIEVQNDKEFDFFHRMNYGQAKLLTEHMHLGMQYDQIKKIYSINIVYFDLGQGDDYIYKGKTEFRGIHTKSLLELSAKQKERYHIDKVSDIYTTYYVLKVNKFNDIAKDTLDEWMYFLKHAELPRNFTAQGLAEAQAKLRIDNLDKAQKQRYNQFVKSWRIFQGTVDSYIYDGVYETEQKYAPILAAKDLQLEAKDKQLEEKDKQLEAEHQKLLDTVKFLLSLGVDISTISYKTGLTEQEVKEMVNT